MLLAPSLVVDFVDLGVAGFWEGVHLNIKHFYSANIGVL